MAANAGGVSHVADLSLSDLGYPTSSFFARAMLIPTHFPMLLTLLVAYVAREVFPWLFVSTLVGMFMSVHYHTCYNFETCFHVDFRMARHIDVYWSMMQIPVLLMAYVVDLDPRTGKFVRPAWVNPYLLVIHVVNLYAHVYNGIDEFANYTAIYITLAVVVVRFVWRVAVRKEKFAVRWLVVLPTAIMVGLGFWAFWLDYKYGAAAHDVWHVNITLAQFYYAFMGPFLALEDGSVPSLLLRRVYPKRRKGGQTGELHTAAGETGGGMFAKRPLEHTA